MGTDGEQNWVPAVTSRIMEGPPCDCGMEIMVTAEMNPTAVAINHTAGQ